ncbi:hypothetical protein TIFTF001_022142 [Ficus carica]|uniref:Uncharacterized protein n=1 Tax=Ficus carica TaxID=3494 RepID=A0AA88ALL1_FICCA|nr:hypothetical protein TIFTF001_022142 [Ficus carica]
MALPSSAVSSNTTAQPGNASTSQDLDRYHPLYLAALKGNWEAAKSFLDNDSDAATARITRTSMTALHVAAGEGRSEFVEKMMSAIPEEALEMRDRARFTALHHAAIAGSMRAAKALVKKKPALANAMDSEGQTPLLIASRFAYGSYDLLWYLTLVTKDEEPSRPFTGPLAMDLVLLLVLSGSVGRLRVVL